MLKMIVASATSIVGTEHGYINLFNEEKGVYERKIGFGYYVEDIGREIKKTEGMSGQVEKPAKSRWSTTTAPGNTVCRTPFSTRCMVRLRCRLRPEKRWSELLAWLS